MKKLTLLCIIALLGVFLHAQNSGKGFAYQAVARDAQGDILTSQNIEIRFSLLPGQHASTPSWQEIHVATTDDFGTFCVTIGKGIKLAGTAEEYGDVDFSTATYWLKVEINDNGTFEEISFAALASIPYAEVANNAESCPTGTIIAFAGPHDEIPTGWALCDGREEGRFGEYAALYNAIGTAWGYGDNSHTFNLPDLRGMFLRGVALESNNDPDKTSRQALQTGGNTGNDVGSKQIDTFKSHSHTASSSCSIGGRHTHSTGLLEHGNSGSATNPEHGDGRQTGAETMTYHNGHTHNITTTIANTGSNETRPINAYVNYIIKL